VIVPNCTLFDRAFATPSSRLIVFLSKTADLLTAIDERFRSQREDTTIQGYISILKKGSGERESGVLRPIRAIRTEGFI
jgi:hypothetical protein